MKRIVLAAIIVLCLPGCIVQSPSAGTATGTSAMMLKLSLTELVSGADWIITGTVTRQESKWDAGHKAIITLITINASRWIKGSSPDGGSTVIVTVPGGSVGNEAQVVEDMPEFTNGENVLLFLKGGSAGEIEVAGGFQGKYTIAGTDAVPYNPQEKMKLDDLVARIRAITAE